MTLHTPKTPPPLISLIAAVARNGVIGSENTLPWRLPEDLKRFKALTVGHPIIMGRKTFDSIGRPLPGRRNIIISRNKDFTAAGCETVDSIEAALALCASPSSGNIESTEIFVIGGAQIYVQAMPIAHKLHLTEIMIDFPGDAHFPAVDSTCWQETFREHHKGDTLSFDFVTYERS